MLLGGGSGLWPFHASTFIRYGARVIIAGRRENVLQDAVKELGPQASFITADLSALENIPALVERIEKDFGPIDVLVNNAGIHLKKDALDGNGRGI